jgi:peptide/nickel transport system substrate-binding protein
LSPERDVCIVRRRKSSSRRAVWTEEALMRHARPTLTALAVALVASLLAASGADGSGAQTPNRGGTIVVGYPGPEPACLNVLDQRCHAGTSLADVFSAVLSSPYEYGPDLVARPTLVTRVTYTKRRPFTLTYRIRPEARWSDGVPITARDFVFTLRAIRRSNLSDARALHRVVRRIWAVDSKTLRVVLRPRYAGWHQLFGFVLPEHALRAEDLTTVWRNTIDNPKNRTSIGSGPFLVEAWERGRELVLRRNPNFWGPRPAYVDRLVVRFTRSPQERAEGLRAGELDIALGLSEEVFVALRREPGIRMSGRPALGFEHLELRLAAGGHPALRKKLVRRALAYGIDRAALVRQIVGHVVPNHPVLDSLTFPTQSRHYEPSWSGYRHRPAEARRLLEDAGCLRGADRIYRCDGQRLSLRFMTSSGLVSRQRTLEIVQRQLREVGVDVQLEYVPVGSLLGAGGLLERGEFDVMLFSWVYQLDPVDLVTVFGCGGANNFTGYCQRLVTADLAQADRILDAGQRARVLRRADRQLARDVPMIPLYQFVLSAAHSARVRGFTLNPGGWLWNAENWWLGE